MILTLADPQARDPQIAGGKGASLARLRAAGFAVPEAFVVPTAAFETACRALTGDVTQAGIQALAFPAGWAEEIAAVLATFPPGTLWAVRSSAVAEDLAEASFAGQYETVLGVRGLEAVCQAVIQCWASFAAQRVEQYRRERNIHEGRGAVVIQRLIRAHAAGVCFTVDPRDGAADRILVNANFGLGESVVGGRVTPDLFVLAKADGRLIEKTLGSKEFVWMWDDAGGSREMPLARARSGAWSLDDEALANIHRLASQVETYEGRPVDIEWAIEEGTLYLLQARPVTALPAREEPIPADWAPELNSAIHPDFPLYSNGNISEVLPGCITPLSWSLIGPALEAGFRRPAQLLGVAPKLPAADGLFVMGSFFHRPYLNISFFIEVARNTPGLNSDAVYEEFVGSPGPGEPALSWKDLLPWRWPLWARFVAVTLHRKTRCLRDIAAARAYYEREWSRVGAAELSTWPLTRLAAELNLTEGRLAPTVNHIWVSQFAVGGFDVLRRLTRRWLGDQDGSLAASLVTGLGSLPSADPAFALHELALKIRGSALLMGVFEAQPDNARVLEAINGRREPEAAQWLQAFGAFLKDFGHRAICEAEVRNPSWREAPEQVLGLIRNYLTGDITPPAQLRSRQERVRKQAEADVAARLGLAQRILFRLVLRESQRFISAREEMKNVLILFTNISRRVLAELRRRLVAEGRLGRADDLYFLTFDELKRLAAGEFPRDEVERVVARRRRDFDWSQRVTAPKLQQGSATFLRDAAPPVGGEQMRGIGVSPGRVEGLARVVLDPRKDARLLPGEILVAPVTDAGWTPLFLHAAGLVVEVGGLLSHGSVVAREYGLPAVVNVAGATRRIKTGDRIVIDGNKGEVWLQAAELL